MPPYSSTVQIDVMRVQPPLPWNNSSLISKRLIHVIHTLLNRYITPNNALLRFTHVRKKDIDNALPHVQHTVDFFQFHFQITMASKWAFLCRSHSYLEVELEKVFQLLWSIVATVYT